MDICSKREDRLYVDDVPNIVIYQTLLEANNKAVHGSFGIGDDKIILKDVLEFENLDANELEASLSMMFITANQTLEGHKRGEVNENLNQSEGSSKLKILKHQKL